MTPEQARRIMTDHLGGRRRVSTEELQQAISFINADPELLVRFHRAIGRDSTCGTLRSRLDEICELSAADLESRMPWVTSHLAGCDACLRSYWYVRGTWEQPDPVLSTPRRLAAPLRIVSDDYGSWRAGTSALPPEEYEHVAAAMAAPLGSPASERSFEWRLLDEDYGVEILVKLTCEAAGRACVRVDLRNVDGPPITDVWIRVLDGAGNVEFEGRPTLLADSPLELDAGNWILVAEANLDGARQFWELPLAIDTEE